MEDEQKKMLLQWHPAFFADIMIEFQEEADKLIFENEHQLGTKPKEIDVLIIKKAGTAPIQKNLGRIFRGHNIIEYKSPEDYLSIDDYYKVLGYAYFYKAEGQPFGEESPKEDSIDIRDITVTMVCHNVPRKLLRHLQQDIGLNVEQTEPGIYYVYGERIPVQIIVTRQLNDKENLWLRSLTNKIKDQDEAEQILRAYVANQNNHLYESVMNIITSANRERFEGENMCEELYKIIEPKIEEKKRIAWEEGREHSLLSDIGI